MSDEEGTPAVDRAEADGPLPPRGPSSALEPKPSRASTAWAAVFCGVTIVVLILNQFTTHRSDPSEIEQLRYPAQMAALLFESQLDAQALDASEWKYRHWVAVIDRVTGERALRASPEEAVAAYRQVLELANLYDTAARDALLARIATACAETGTPSDAAAALEEMSAGPLATRFKAGFRFAYGYSEDAAALDPADIQQVLAPGPVPWWSGWTTTRLRARAERQAGREAQAALVEGDHLRQLERTQLRTLATCIPLVAVLLTGIGLGIIFLTRRRLPDLRVARAPIPARWPAAEAFSGCFLASVVALLLAIFAELAQRGTVPPALGWSLYALGVVPFIVLLRRLLGPTGISIPAALGLRLAPGSWRRLLMACVLFGAADLLLECVVLGLLIPATQPDWWDASMQSLLLGSWAEKAALVLGITLGAPLIEETAFRGILYPTLRRFWRPVPAALVVGAVFGLGHNSPPAGLIAIACAGAGWALAFEVTGSLWPSLIGHAFNNGIISLMVLTATRQAGAIAVVTAGAAVLALHAAPVDAHTLATPQSNRVVQHWTVADGLPQGTINKILFAPDGRVWLATFGGLVLFDGADFEVFDLATLPGLPSNRITALAFGPDDALWLGTEHDGVVCLRDERIVTVLPAPDAHSEIVDVAIDPAGVVWVRESTGGLWHAEDGAWVRQDLPLTGASPGSVAADSTGNLWVGNSRQIVCLVPGGVLGLALAAPSRVLGISRSANGQMAVAMEGGFARLRNAKLEPGPVEPRLDAAVTAVANNDAGSIVAATADGCIWALREAGKEAAWIRQDLLAQLPSGIVAQSLAFDRNGGVWVGTRGWGLLHLPPERVLLLRLGDGYVEATAVASDGQGGAYIGFGCAGLAQAEGPRGPLHFVPFPASPEPDCVNSLLRDSRGRTWAGRGERVWRWRDGESPRKLPVECRGGAVAIAETATGVWVVTRYGTLLHYDAGDALVEQLELGATVQCMKAAPDGTLLIGAADGFFRHAPGSAPVWVSLGGGSARTVRDVLATADGTVWIGTYGTGLGRMANGAVGWVTTEQGLPDNAVSHVLDDGRGRLWLLTNRGLVSIPTDDLERASKGAGTALDAVVYGPESGMAEGSYGGPAGFVDTAGNMWFTTVSGVAVLNGAALPYSSEAPTAVVDRIFADGRLQSDAEPVRITAGTARLELEFTAGALVSPAGVRFRYRLGGVDRDWVAAATARRAIYTHLPPGRRTFEVLARNEDGVWSTAPTAVQLEILPAWWQHPAVQAGFGLAGLGLLLGAHFGRIRVVRRRGEAMTRKAEERREAEAQASRIRVELEHLARVSTAGALATSLAHEVNQPLSAIVNNAEAARRFLERGPDAKADLSAILKDIADQGQRASEVVRRLREFLRRREVTHEDFDLNDVVHAVMPLVRRELSDQHVELRPILAPGLPRVRADRIQLQQVLVNLIQNACEAMNTSSGEHRITVTTRRAGEMVRMEVQDTGPGLDPKVAARLFQHFVTTKADGMGLGLAICHTLVEASDGRIVHERPETGGARFAVELPARS